MTSTRPRRRLRSLGVAVTSVGLVSVASGVAIAASIPPHAKVGDKTAHGHVLPSQQTVSPLGRRTLINNGRLLSSVISPDGRHLAALSWNDFNGFLSVFDVRNGKLVQQVGTGTDADPKIGDATVAADGPIYSPDGRTLWFSQTADILKFTVRADGTVDPKPTVIPMGDAKDPYLPSGGVFSADGKTLYLALNNKNTVAVVDTATGRITRQIKVGVAPRQVAMVGGTLYVSNEGGRRATSADFTNLTSGTPVVADKVTGAVNNGTLSAVDLGTGHVATIKVGLEPTALYARGADLFVANSNDDSVSIVDTRTNTVAQTFNVNPLPGSTVGSYPNAITMPDAGHIFVSIGRDNAIAVYRYNGSAKSPVQYLGLIPTDWYPVGVQYDAALGKVVVTNDKGIGARGLPKTISEGPDARTVTNLNTYSDTGSLTSFALPTEADLARLTHTVFVDNNWQQLLASTPLSTAARAGMRPVALPSRLGAPSAIKHVFLIVKENRTYDQVLGDIDRGNGDANLTQFGGSVTPNQHALASTYGLFDNFYDEGTLSADGHNWLMQADANDYIEKEFGAFYRSYPAQGGDALAYQRDGFIWNAAQAAGKTVKAFGEYNNFFTAEQDPKAPSWSQWYQDALIMEGKAKGPLPVPVGKYTTYSDIPSLNAITDHTYPRFNTGVPDQYRTDIWLKSFRASEKTGKLANLNMLWVPDDHTSGTSGTDPYPTAAVADNDLAVGRIVDAISHSQFWKDSAVFVLEDDSQNGTDHVDGHRSTLFVASPYAKRGVVNSTYYTQLNVVKTIEQILGIAPMNQEDRAAVPMTDAFTNKPDLTPFTTRPNQIPLTYGLTTNTSSAKSAPAPAPSKDPRLSALQEQWRVWSKAQVKSGAIGAQDSTNPAQMNRLDWYASTKWARPYPGDPAILSPYQVPGWDRPAAEIG